MEPRPVEVEVRPVEEPRPVEDESRPVEVESRPVEVESRPVEVELRPAEVELRPAEVELMPAGAKGGEVDEEGTGSRWKGKEMDELLEAFRRKFEPSERHVETIKNFPRRKDELFQHKKDRIAASKNPDFLQELYGNNDVNSLVASLQMTEAEYEMKHKKKLPDIQVRPTMGATGGRGKDTQAASNARIKSESWLNGMLWAYNMITDFVAENKEFGCFDWESANLEDIDIFVGYLWVWMGPKEGGGSLGGTRYTTDSLKQIKTKIQNVVINMMKRKDVDLSSISLTFANNMYNAKRNSTAIEPMKGNAGDRKRTALSKEDSAKMDDWMLSDLDQVVDIGKIF